MTNNTSGAGRSPFAKEPTEESRETGEKDLTQAEPGDRQGSHHPENKEGADKATAENDLTTGHSSPSDGGADNAKAGQRNA